MTHDLPPGWHPDPLDQSRSRYWDGRRWGDETLPRGASVSEPTIPIVNAYGPTQADGVTALLTPRAPQPFWKRRGVQIGAGVVAALVLLGAVVGEDESADPAPTAAQGPASGAPPAVSPTVAPPTEEPNEEPADGPAEDPVEQPGEEEPAPEGASSAGVASDESAVTSTDDTFVMPQQVGQDLQVSQDALQAASGNPVYFSTSEDALGLGRFQVIDSNWIVCSQTPAAGTPVGVDDLVNFAVVKDTEICP